MKHKSQLLESIDRFRQSFWAKKNTGRPPIGVVPADIFMPIKYLRQEITSTEILPQEINENFYRNNYEFAFASRPVSCDDFIPFASPWRAIPWLEAICGCPVHYAQGSLAAGHYVKCVSDLNNIQLPANLEWSAKLTEEINRLLDHIPSDCWVSPTILRGPSDILAAICGLTEFYCYLLDMPSVLNKVAGQINRILLNLLDIHFSLVEPKYDGYGHIYGYWAPQKTVIIQEDAMGMCSPQTYHDIFRQYNQDIVNHLGNHVLFHLHSTGYEHYQHVLEIDGIGGLQLTIESNGPALRDIVPDLKHILERSRLILFVDNYFDQLPEVLKKIPHEGLYLIIPDKYINTEKNFVCFCKDNF